MKETAIKYAQAACEKMISDGLPAKSWHSYHAGVSLSGMLNTYYVTGEERYFNYIKEWVDSVIPEKGIINSFAKGSLDDYMAGILISPVYERFQEEKYLYAVELFAGNIRNWLKNSIGGFHHKEWYPEQMWLDGLYMAGPLQTMFAKMLNEPEFYDEAVKQALLMYNNMRDDSGLLRHAWDESKEAPWADKTTGLSPEVWGRAMGWYIVACLDIAENLPIEHIGRQKLFDIAAEMIDNILPFADKESGMWYQVLHKPNERGNWIETSASALFVYSIAKAVRLGIVDKSYASYAKKAFDSICSRYVTLESGFKLSGVCIGTGVCNYQEYIERPTTENDLHGMGAFMLMCAEIARL